jgi:hypothetical protein
MVLGVEGTEEEEWCEEKERHKPGPEIRCLAQGQGLPGHAQRLYSPTDGVARLVCQRRPSALF